MWGMKKAPPGRDGAFVFFRTASIENRHVHIIGLPFSLIDSILEVFPAKKTMSMFISMLSLSAKQIPCLKRKSQTILQPESPFLITVPELPGSSTCSLTYLLFPYTSCWAHYQRFT
jgi:hypothetical protein